VAGCYRSIRFFDRFVATGKAKCNCRDGIGFTKTRKKPKFFKLMLQNKALPAEIFIDQPKT
jgi:hypothetical protein